MADSAQKLFEQAVALHRSGEIDKAQEAYRAVLAVDSNHAWALHQLGLIAFSKRDFGHAIDLLSKATHADPASAAFQTNLGSALASAGRKEEARNAFERSIGLDPKIPAAYTNLANVYRELNLTAEVEQTYRRAINAIPKHFHAYMQLAILLRQRGAWKELAAVLRTLARIAPSADAEANLCDALINAGDLEGAIAAGHRALGLKESFPIAHNNLANALRAKLRVSEAVEHYKRAIELEPNYARAFSNLGAALKDLGQINEAIGAFRRAIELKNDLADAWNNLGNTLREIAQIEEVENAIRKAIEIQPDFPTAHFNLAWILLQKGEYREGWPEYEWRLKDPTNPLSARTSSKPKWNGEDLKGKSLLVLCEQGFGDSFQFVRYIQLINKNARVFLECPPELKNVLNGLPNVQLATGREDYDFHTPLISLPRIFNTTIATIPNRVPYLSANPGLVERWKMKLSNPKFKVGLIWAGRTEHTEGLYRTCCLEQMKELLKIDGIAFYSLQKGHAVREIQSLEPSLRPVDLSNDLVTFSETAATMENLDLILSIDTGPAHLAGALGKETWLMLPFAADWRWLLSRADSPWYPTMRLFRQKKAGDWEGVISEVAAAMNQRLRERR